MEVDLLKVSFSASPKFALASQPSVLLVSEVKCVSGVILCSYTIHISLLFNSQWLENRVNSNIIYIFEELRSY